MGAPDMDSSRFKICIPGRKKDVSGTTLNHEAKVPSPTSITTLGKKTMENTLFTWSPSPKGKILLFDEWCLFSPLNLNFRSKGRDPYKKVAYFRALPESGGFTDAQICWPFFYQVKVPKIGTFLLKNHNICMFFAHFFIIIIKITIITIMIIMAIIIIIIGTFFLSYP